MDWQSIVKTIAPWIGTALGGPLGGMAVSAVADAFGLTDKTEDAIKQALSGATPEQMLSLKQADQAFALHMQELGFKQVTDLEACAAGDRASARDMNKVVRSNIPATLSIIVTLGFFSVLVGMMTGTLSAEDKQALLIMLGSLSTAWGMVMAFWFGTTNDSGRKTEIIAASNTTK